MLSAERRAVINRKGASRKLRMSGSRPGHRLSTPVTSEAEKETEYEMHLYNSEISIISMRFSSSVVHFYHETSMYLRDTTVK